ncbi:MAG: right-handed parallel beta-helix repeat-containing protein [Pirellulales bacterium]
MFRQHVSRRRFLGRTVGMFGAAGWAASAFAGPPPQVVNPRATDGDDRHEPDWKQRLTITVGRKDADLVGDDDKVLQAAVDYMARLGGGSVRVLPGTYRLRNAVWLPSGIRLTGCGVETVITKHPSRTVALADDSDWYDQEITLEDAAGFEVGDGVVLRAKNPHHGGQEVIKRTLVARNGRRFKLNDGLRKNLWLTGKPTCASLFPLLTSERTADVVIENLTLDGNRANNERLDGNHAGCIFLQDCNRITIRDVTTRNYNGDGISFQICHDVVVENCHSHDNADLGVHPGSGAQRPIVRGNRLERNGIGIFWCWGVKFGLAEGNRIEQNRRFGISIGHADTDNVMRNNEIVGSGEVGVLFRDDSRGRDFWPNRNRLENNRIVDSGGETGIGIDVQGKTRDLHIGSNTIRESRGPAQRIGIRIGKEVGSVVLADNRVEGFSQAVVDQRTNSV